MAYSQRKQRQRHPTRGVITTMDDSEGPSTVVNLCGAVLMKMKYTYSVGDSSSALLHVI